MATVKQQIIDNNYRISGSQKVTLGKNVVWESSNYYYFRIKERCRMSMNNSPLIWLEAGESFIIDRSATYVFDRDTYLEVGYSPEFFSYSDQTPDGYEPKSQWRTDNKFAFGEDVFVCPITVKSDMTRYGVVNVSYSIGVKNNHTNTGTIKKAVRFSIVHNRKAYDYVWLDDIDELETIYFSRSFNIISDIRAGDTIHLNVDFRNSNVNIGGQAGGQTLKITEVSI